MRLLKVPLCSEKFNSKETFQRICEIFMIALYKYTNRDARSAYDKALLVPRNELTQKSSSSDIIRILPHVVFLFVVEFLTV